MQFVSLSDFPPQEALMIQYTVSNFVDISVERGHCVPVCKFGLGPMNVKMHWLLNNHPESRKSINMQT